MLAFFCFNSYGLIYLCKEILFWAPFRVLPAAPRSLAGHAFLLLGACFAPPLQQGHATTKSLWGIRAGPGRKKIFYSNTTSSPVVTL